MNLHQLPCTISPIPVPECRAQSLITLDCQQGDRHKVVPPLQGIAAAAVLLDEPAYRPAVLMGLTFSIGGVDVPLAEAAASALLRHSSAGEKKQ